MNLNVDVHNAVTRYQAFYMVRILDDANPFAQKSRDAARSEFVSANRNYNDAKRLYHRIN